jgi:hypothetical protein
MATDIAAAEFPASETTGPASPPTAYWPPPSRAEPAPAASRWASIARLVAVGKTTPTVETQTNRGTRTVHSGPLVSTAAHKTPALITAVTSAPCSISGVGKRRSSRTVADPAMMMPAELRANTPEKALELRPYSCWRTTELTEM